jgi:hypothetical protein
MAVRAYTIPFLAAALILGAVGTVVVLLRGTGTPSTRGIAVGLGLGAGGTALEGFMVTRALKGAGNKALGIFLGGFGIRLIALMGIALWFHYSGVADPVAFALCFVGGFLAGLPLLAAATASRKTVNGGGRP